MEKTINTLKAIRQRAKEDFVNNSLIIYNSNNDEIPLPDTNADLEMIKELNLAISILQNSTFEKK